MRKKAISLITMLILCYSSVAMGKNIQNSPYVFRDVILGSEKTQDMVVIPNTRTEFVGPEGNQKPLEYCQKNDENYQIGETIKLKSIEYAYFDGKLMKITMEAEDREGKDIYKVLSEKFGKRFIDAKVTKDKWWITETNWRYTKKCQISENGMELIWEKKHITEYSYQMSLLQK